MEKNKTVTAYKGFDNNLQCRGFQYEVGGEYTTDRAVACETGFHCCENPLDVLGYYSPLGRDGTPNRFCEVEAGGDIDTSEVDKLCSTHIKVKAEIGLKGLVKAGVKFILDRVSMKKEKNAATAGNYANAATAGDYANAATTGDYAHAATAGNRAHAATAGDDANAATTGNRANAATAGYRAHAATAGDCANAATAGDCANAATAGNCANASVCKPDCIAVVTGKDCKAKGGIGSWIVLTERGEWNGKGYPVKCVKAFKVDGNEIKADTWYKLVDGCAVEVE